MGDGKHLPPLCPPRHQAPNLGDPTSHARLIKERLRRWQAGECDELWQEAKEAKRRDELDEKMRKSEDALELMARGV